MSSPKKLDLSHETMHPENLDIRLAASAMVDASVKVDDGLGTHVVERANDLVARDARLVRLDGLRDAEVDELHDAADEDEVCRLQVRVHNA